MIYKVYISGKITGLPKDEAVKLFKEAETMILNHGNIAVNPLDLNPEGLTWKECMLTDIKHLMDCDAIFMLENWKDSKGARIEHCIAENMGLIRIYYTGVSIIVNDSKI